jgi:hypothetical protein
MLGLLHIALDAIGGPVPQAAILAAEGGLREKAPAGGQAQIAMPAEDAPQARPVLPARRRLRRRDRLFRYPRYHPTEGTAREHRRARGICHRRPTLRT